MLRFLVDESTGRGVTEWLSAAGHDVICVTESLPQARDSDILDLAVQDQRIIITNDKDFGELVFRSGRQHAGILLLRLNDESASNRIRMVSVAVESHECRLKGAFTVVTEKNIRIRSG
jgi:predicted nuclease of predicted toxin-antitoxin system